MGNFAYFINCKDRNKLAMKLKILNFIDSNQIVSSYAIPDIYNLIWTFIRYGKDGNRNLLLIKVSSYGEGLEKYSFKAMC